MDSSEIIRGHTEAVILEQLVDRDCYGYQITRNIYDNTDGLIDLKDATIYTAFRRMEKLNYISSYWGDSEQGARRRYYAITQLGKDFLALKQKEWLQTKKILNKLIIGE